MPVRSLADFVRVLRAAGELTVVDAAVDPYLEVAEITDRVVKAGGPALLFTNVAQSPYCVLTNQFGSERRMALALGADSLAALEGRIRKAIDLSVPDSWGGKLGKLVSLTTLASAIPRTVASGPCQEVIDHAPDLRELPVLTTWPLDGGPFITLPLVFTKDPVSGAQNVGMYRVQIYDRNTTGMHWQRHKQGRAHAEKWGRRIPVAVVIGADPAITYSATAPLPPIVDEMALAGFLRGAPVEMVRCQTIDLKVPAHAEFVLEGHVDNEEMRIEGPFGDHTGVYSLADYYPTFHVQCITRRTTPIYAATVVGKPPMEDAWLGKATERLFLPLLQLVVPEIVDYNLPVEGGFHNLAIVAVRKSYPGQAKKVMNALWGLGHMMMLTRVLLVVDHDVDPADVRGVVWNALNNVDPSRDLVVMPGPVDDLDHSGSYLMSLGHKLGIDATRKRADEGYSREWPPEILMNTETRERVSARWAEYGIGDLLTGTAHAWSGQGPDRLRRLLDTAPMTAGTRPPLTAAARQARVSE